MALDGFSFLLVFFVLFDPVFAPSLYFIPNFFLSFVPFGAITCVFSGNRIWNIQLVYFRYIYRFSVCDFRVFFPLGLLLLRFYMHRYFNVKSIFGKIAISTMKKDTNCAAYMHVDTCNGKKIEE